MSDRRWAHVRRLILCFFFVIFLSFSFFSKFSDAFRQTSTLYSIWLTFVFLGERYWTSSASSGRACVLSYFRQSRGDYYPSRRRRRGWRAREVFVATTISFAECGTKSSSASRTTMIIRLFCPDTTIRPRRESSSRINLAGCTSSANLPLPNGIFSALCVVGLVATNTTRRLGAFYRRDISR